MTAARVIRADDLRGAVRFSDLVEPVARAFQASSAGDADNGLLVMLPADRPTDGDVFVKTSTLRGHPLYIVKIAPWFALNVQQGRPQGGLLAVFDSRTGHTLAVLEDEHYLSDIRTAAAGSVAARVLAPAVVDTALVIGSGVQAYWQPQALYKERPFRTLLLWARNNAKATALAARLADVLPEVQLRVVNDLEDAAGRADVLLTTTQARDPVVRGAWLRPSQHVTAIGADDQTKCELDAQTLQRARVFVDARDTAAATGEVYRFVYAGHYALADLAGEIGEVLAGSVPGRTSDDDITVATLAGLGVQDLVTAEVVLRVLGIPTNP
ncbi:MAG: ornithine cyclodeaminase family protein [Solirubrobacterales bacterium]|nr:ornithine cyclodeaminase family protein [Solirubrobacterales bacterium]